MVDQGDEEGKERFSFSFSFSKKNKGALVRGPWRSRLEEMIRWRNWGMGGALLLFALAVLPHGEAVYTKVSGPFLAL